MRGLVAAGAGILVIACSTSSCQWSQPADEEAKTVDDSLPVARAPIADVLRRHTPSLLGIPGVVGTGEGRAGDRPVIVIFVARRTDQVRQQLPSALEGYPVEIRESGDVTAPPR